MAAWKEKCAEEYKLEASGIPMPDNVDWEFVYNNKPLGRNLLKNPAPYGLSHNTPPPDPEGCQAHRPRGPPLPEPIGDYREWTKSRTEPVEPELDIPPGVVVCMLPSYSWLTLEQRVDLLAEGLWPELLDGYQPDIAVEDWYEESQIHDDLYELQVTLLGSDGLKVIKEMNFKPEGNKKSRSNNWKQVSLLFTDYGPGVRYIHFLHRLRLMFMFECHSVHVTDSSIIVKPSK